MHFKAPFLLTQRLLPLIADGGRVINVSSGLARMTIPGYAAYGAMKAAIEVLTRYAAKELGARQITANVIAPGAIATDFGGGMVRDNPELNQWVASNDGPRPRRPARRRRRRGRDAALARERLDQRPADRGVRRAGPLKAGNHRKPGRRTPHDMKLVAG